MNCACAIRGRWVHARHIFLAPFCWMLLAAGSFAQVPPRVISPEVSTDHRVTIRFFAPGASAVSVDIEGFLKPLAMTKDNQGVWSVTTGPLDPEYYGYSILMDGVPRADPENPLFKPNLLTAGSMVHVPGPPSLPWETNDVPHGVIHHEFYHSGIVGDNRDFYVYTPPGYDPSAQKTYPVLYLLHGYSDDASGWTAVGRANVILDNLIHDGKARPMIVVMPLGYGAPAVITGGWAHVGNAALFKENYEKFGETLLHEIIPMVEREYRVETDRDSRAIAGLSMGGAETLFVGLNHADKFAYIGAFSSGGLHEDYAETFPNFSAGTSKLRVLWMSCGKDDHLLAPNEKLRDWLEGKGLHVQWVETSGAHWWPVWRQNLATFLPQLFRQE
jgi:enterochelin esterase-like enzyme